MSRIRLDIINVYINNIKTNLNIINIELKWRKKRSGSLRTTSSTAFNQLYNAFNYFGCLTFIVKPIRFFCKNKGNGSFCFQVQVEYELSNNS